MTLSITKPALITLVAGFALTLTACAGAVSPTPTNSIPSATDAERHCVDKGGVVEERQPTFGTNEDPALWVPMGETVKLCSFQTLGDADDSRIYVDLVTISASTPTLAALAYLSKAQLPDEFTGNPATALCAQLGGSSTYGPGAGGGGLISVEDPENPDLWTVAACVFPDRSFIDEWGIAYYGAGEIRGIDLTTVFQFDQTRLPPVFG